MKLKDKVAIITGGSRGIGRTVSEFFVNEGARVVVFSRSRDEIRAAKSEIDRVSGKKIEGVLCDVSDAAAVARAVRRIGKRFHRIDVLVNCAGIQPPIGPFIDDEIEAWKRNVAVNLFGTAAMCKAVIPFMMKKHAGRARGGTIVNFAGGGAASSRPNFSAYAASKTAITRFTEVIADELKPYHIRVNAVSPGPVNTFMSAEVVAAGAAAGRDELAATKARLESGGGVSPEIPAALVVFLASRDSEGLSGRLVSAPYDDWRKWTRADIEKIMASDKFTLRRVVK
jgi:NAD(P)-dependent dehydrogenase (short-subunit alcohol dehydrogenase family)